MIKLFAFLLLFSLLLFTYLIFWSLANRKYTSKDSVAKSYDEWTNDQLLESLWGEHIHLGFYAKGQKNHDFRQAKIEFVHQLVKWSGLNQLPKGSRILDVGCGIGGSARILARDYGFEVVGVTISQVQIQRANQLTPKNLNCSFRLMDALDLSYKEDTFDGVWSVEAGPHIPDKQLYADEMLRVLKPNGIMVVADWNRRDTTNRPINNIEKLIMKQLLNQWTHSEFSSIQSFSRNILSSPFFKGSLKTDDWTKYTISSWNDSIIEGFRRPYTILKLGPRSVIMGLREIPTILMMRWAFSYGLMQFGVFKKTN